MLFIPLSIAAGILYFNAKKNEKLEAATSQDLKTNLKPDDANKLPQTTRTQNTPPAAFKLKDYHQDKSLNKGFIAAVSAFTLATLAPLPFFRTIALPLVVYAFKDLYYNVYQRLKQGKVNAHTLVAITISGLLFITGGLLFASMISVLFLSSVKLSAMLTNKSRQNIQDIFEKTPEQVWLVLNDVETQVPYEQIKAGDIVVAHAGSPIPVDGTIIEGCATIDQHVLTGESQPVEKAVGDGVFSSTILLSGKIYIKVEHAGADTTVAKITQILNDTVDFKSNLQMRSERISQDLVLPTLISSGLAIPLLGMHSALAVVNSHPKEKIAVVAPISTLNFINIALKNNILIKDGRALELLNTVDTVVFDKTGTLTVDCPTVGKIHCLADYQANDILAYAATAEYKQNHPLAKAILRAAETQGIQLSAVEETEYKLGYGLSVIVNQRKIHVGSARFMQAEHLNIPEFLQQQQILSQQQGYTLVMVAVDGEVCGGIELLPQVRPEAMHVIQYLQAQGKKTCIISGDHAAPTRNLANRLGIDEYFAQVLPQDKAAIIKQLQDEGRTVCFIGDGINDSIALKQSQVSISLSGASSIAVDTAEIILLDQGLTHLPCLFEIASRYKQNMDATFAILLIPAAVSLGGVFLLHFGLIQTIALNMLGLTGGLGNAMLPMLVEKIKEDNAIKDKETTDA